MFLILKFISSSLLKEMTKVYNVYIQFRVSHLYSCSFSILPNELPLPAERRELTSPASIASFLLVIKPLIVRDHCCSFHRFTLRSFAWLLSCAAGEAQSFRSNRARMDASNTSSAGISPFHGKLTSRLLCLLLARHGERGGLPEQTGASSKKKKKKPRRQLLISTLCAPRASRGRRAPVSPGAGAEARSRRWKQADEKTPRGWRAAAINRRTATRRDLKATQLMQVGAKDGAGDERPVITPNRRPWLCLRQPWRRPPLSPQVLSGLMSRSWDTACPSRVLNWFPPTGAVKRGSNPDNHIWNQDGSEMKERNGFSRHFSQGGGKSETGSNTWIDDSCWEDTLVSALFAVFLLAWGNWT